MGRDRLRRHPAPGSRQRLVRRTARAARRVARFLGNEGSQDARAREGEGEEAPQEGEEGA